MLRFQCRLIICHWTSALLFTNCTAVSSNSYFFTTSFYFSPLWSTKWNWEIISFPHRFQGSLGNDDFTFPKFFFLKITKQHTASVISILNTGETNKIELPNYLILRMRVFIQDFTYIEKGVKYCSKKFTYPKC